MRCMKKLSPTATSYDAIHSTTYQRSLHLPSHANHITTTRQNNYVYCEDISLDYTFAQSVLFKIYGNAIQETGHLTKGHTCLTDADRLNAQYVKGSLLYGELLPRGANKVNIM